MPVTPLPPGTPSAGFFIEDEERFTGGPGQFAGALFDVVVPDGAGGYVSRSVEESHLAELLGVTHGPNLRSDGFKSVRFLSRTDPRFDPTSDHALDELDTTLGCLGTTCYVDFEKVRYVLVYDADPRPGGPASGKQTWRDGHMAYPTPLVPCKWVPESAPEAVAVNVPEYDPAFNSTGTPPGYPVGFEVRYRLAGIEGHYVANVAGQLPAPTSPSNDANWRRVAPPTPATVIYQVMPYAAALNYDGDDQLTRGREYLITERPGGGPDVRGTFTSFGPARMQYATLEGQAGAYEYDLTSNQATAANGSVYDDTFVLNTLSDHENRIDTLETRVTALGTAPPYVSITAGGVRSTTASSLTQAISLAAEGGTVIVNRSTPGSPSNTLIGRNITLDLQGHQLDLLGADLHLYSGARIVNIGLIHSGRIFVRDSNTAGIQMLQGGLVATQIYSQAGTNPVFRLYGTQVVNFGAGQPTPATLSPTQNPSVGNLSVELHEGAAFVDYPPAPQTTVTIIPPTPSAGGGIDYANPLTLNASTTLTSADFGKSIVLIGSGGTLTLPDPTAHAGSLIGIRVGNNCTGIWTITAADIDGQPARYLHHGESRELIVNGTSTGYRKQNGNTIALAARIQGDGTGNYTVSGQMSHPLAVVFSDNSGGLMVANTNQIAAPRPGKYLVLASMMMQTSTAMSEADLFVAFGGFYSNPKSMVDIDTPAGPAYVNLKIAKTVDLAAGNFFTMVTYTPGTATVDNRAANPAYIPSIELLEQPSW